MTNTRLATLTTGVGTAFFTLLAVFGPANSIAMGLLGMGVFFCGVLFTVSVVALLMEGE